MKILKLGSLAALLLLGAMSIRPAFADGPAPGGGGGSTIGTPVSVANGGTASAIGDSGPYAQAPWTIIWGGASYQHTTGSIAWTQWGGAMAQTDNGTKTNATCFSNGAPHTGPCLQYVSVATTGSFAGLTFAAVEAAARGRWIYNVTLGSTATGRLWVTQASAAIGSHAPPTGAAAYVTAQYVGLAFDSAVNSGKWLVVSGDGANESGTDTGITVAANTTYVVDIDCLNYSTSCRVGVNSVDAGALTYTTKSSNVAGAFTGTAVFAETRANVALTLQLRPYLIGMYQ